MPLVLHNETQLVRDMQSGCEDAFTALYKFYSPRLYLNILAMIRDPLAAEEIVQELFTRVWQKRHYKGISENFPGYLYKIGQRLVLDFFRKMKRDQTLMDKFRNAASENFEDIHDELYQKQFATILERAISQLSPQQKKVHELVKMRGYSYKKTAEVLNISPLTVKEYLVTARKIIRNFVKTQVDSSAVTIVFAIFLSV